MVKRPRKKIERLDKVLTVLIVADIHQRIDAILLNNVRCFTTANRNNWVEDSTTEHMRKPHRSAQIIDVLVAHTPTETQRPVTDSEVRAIHRTMSACSSNDCGPGMLTLGKL